jgi:uncharacterized membrane protein
MTAEYITVEQIRAFLGWGAVCNIAFLGMVIFLYLTCRDVLYRLYGQCFDIPKETINTVLFGAFVFYELIIFAFFIMPYLALRFCV